MRFLSLVFISLVTLAACQNPTSEDKPAESSISPQFDQFLDNYYENRMRLFPLEATLNGDNRFNDTMTIDISESERDKVKTFLTATLDSLVQFNYEKLTREEKLSYDVLKETLSLGIEGFKFHDNYIPINQFYSVPAVMGQLGSGESAQPFATVQDYENWLKRLDIYINWIDTSIIYFRKGMESNLTLPKSLVRKVIPQVESMIVKDSTKSLFYNPVNLMPATFSDSEKTRLTQQYGLMIVKKLVPAYKRLNDFLKQEYLPAARNSSGIDSTANGNAYYRYLVRVMTTTEKSPEEIYQTGLKEVERIRTEMERIKDSVGFKGSLAAFFKYMETNRRFMPYKKPEDVLQAFQSIYDTIRPHISTLFNDTPKTKFEIRRTEAFREASASAEYNPGTPDGKRPGIFYVPIVNARKYNTTSGMQSLFLHEAIPGHHFQISLQQENKDLPLFRRFSYPSAYTEGWALYCESLGKQLGLYKDPYQYMGALGDEIHRAIRLVVDVAIHTKGMTREEAIKYMMSNEPASEQYTTAEIERYMAYPAQALAYKTGALKIQELKETAQKELGSGFAIDDFHTQILKDGALPLSVLESKINNWIQTEKSAKRK